MSDADTNYIQAALEHLKSLGVTASVTAPQDNVIDGHVQLDISGKVFNYDVVLKHRINSPEQLNAIYFHAHQYGKALLFTDQLTATQAKHCKDIGLQFVDQAGNAYINGPGVLIFTSGQRTEKVASKHVRVSVMTTAMVRTVFVLLADPEYVNKPYREIAIAAQVSLGGVAQTFEMLNARKFVLARAHGRQLQSIRQLIIEWAAAYLQRLRPKLGARRFEAPVDFAQVWKPVSEESAWGGEFAADIATRNLRPEFLTIYMDTSEARALTKMVKLYKLRLAQDGNLEIVSAFWNMGMFAHNVERVPLHLVYADLTMTLDPRNLEVAAKILDLAEAEARA